MYKFDKNHQFSLADFNQPMGLKMNPENRWVKKAETIPWDAIEEKYAALFPSKKGMPAKKRENAAFYPKGAFFSCILKKKDVGDYL